MTLCSSKMPHMKHLHIQRLQAGHSPLTELSGLHHKLPDRFSRAYDAGYETEHFSVT